MGKKFLSVMLALVMTFSMGSVAVFATDDIEEPIVVNEESPAPIDRTLSDYCEGGAFKWVILYGDNNLFSEFIRLTNHSNKDLVVIVYSGYNDILADITLTASGTGMSKLIYVPSSSGTYWIQAWYEDLSAGWISIHCKTE